MSDRYLAAVLEDCVRAMRSGASREDCLRAYPELRADLAPLLRGAAALQMEPAAAFDSRTRVRQQVMMSIRSEPRERRRFLLPVLPSFDVRRPSRKWSLAAVPLAALIVAVVLGFLLAAPAGDEETMRTSTVLTVLQGEVLVETPNGIIPAKSGMRLSEVDRVITAPDARAVLTFFDGSTVTLEPDTVLSIDAIREVDNQLKATLTQEKGRTWTHTPEDLGPANLTIDTPNAAAQTTGGGSFETAVTAGRTEVVASTGAVSVQSGENRTDVPGGSRAGVDPAGVVDAPSVAPIASRELVVRVTGADFVTLADPSGATVGLVPPGVPVNQIPGATRVGSTGVTTIRIPNPADGAYRLSAKSNNDTAIQVAAVVNDAGTETPVAAFKAGAEEIWQVRFAVAGNDVQPQAVALESRPTNAVVVPSAAAEKAAEKASATPTPRPSSTPTATSTTVPTLTPTARPAVTPKAVLTPAVVDSQNLTNDSAR